MSINPPVRFVSVKFSPIGRPQTFLLDDLAFVDSPLTAGEKVVVQSGDGSAVGAVVPTPSTIMERRPLPEDSPNRVVLDLSKSSLASRLPAGEGVVTTMRSGKLPHSGIRLVFEVSGPVTVQTSTAAPSGDAGHRLILDIAGPGSANAGVAKTVAVTPAVPVAPVAIRPAHAPSETGRGKC